MPRESENFEASFGVVLFKTFSFEAREGFKTIYIIAKMVLETRRNVRALVRVCSFFGSLVPVNRVMLAQAIILFR